MRLFRLGAIFFDIYELFRFFLSLWLFKAGARDIAQTQMPLLFALTAPQFIFPVMAIFLSIDSSRYKAFLPLFYMAKVLSGIMLCLGVFLVLPNMLSTGGHLLQTWLKTYLVFISVGALDLLMLIPFAFLYRGQLTVEGGLS